MTTGGAITTTAVGTVNTQTALLNSVGSQYREHLLSALDRLSHIRVDGVRPPSGLGGFEPPKLTFTVDDPPDRALELASLLGVPPTPDVLGLLKKIDLGDVPDLPSPPLAPLVVIPEAPGFVGPDKPMRPDIDGSVPIPDAPAMSLPELRALHEIKLPADPTIDLPTFEALPPEPDFTVPGGVLFAWVEPEYKPEMYDELVAKVREWLQGGTGLPPYIEEALFARARQRDERETSRTVREAFDTWASRGFGMPPGMLVAAVDAAREEGRFRAAETNRDVLIEATKWEIENLRFAVQQGIALEELWINLFENATKRLFEAARFHAQSQVDLLNVRVALFNAQAQAYGLLVEHFKARLQAAMAQIDVWKGKLEGLGLIGQLNSHHLEEFKTRVQAVGQAADVFKALMEGAKVHVDIQRGQVDMYRADVQAYGEELSAEKVKFDVFKSRVDGELAKVSVHEANARAYAATVQGLTAGVDARAKASQVVADAARVMVAAYQAEVGAIDTHNRSHIAKLSAEADVLKARIMAWEAKSRSNIAESEAKTRFADLGVRTNLAEAEMRIKAYEVQQSKAVQEAQVAVSAASAMGQYAAQIAAGAMSAINVSAGVDARTQFGEMTYHNYSYSDD